MVPEPAHRSAADPPLARLVAVVERFVAVVVVASTEDVGVFDPYEGLEQLPALGDEGVAEGKRQLAGGVGHVDPGSRGEDRVRGRKRLRQQRLEPRGAVARDREAGLRLALVVDAVGGIGPEELGPLLSHEAGAALGIAGVGAQQAVSTEAKQVAGPGLRLGG